MDCIFCKIANGEIPSLKIYEDDIVFAFLDINPDSDGHTLIIPKKHFENYFDTPEEIQKHMNKIYTKRYKRMVNAIISSSSSSRKRNMAC